MERDRFVISVSLGRWQTNCFIVGDRSKGTAAIIDPGETGAEVVPGILEQAGVTAEAILVTHGHLDHFWAVPDLARSLDTQVYLHPEDRWLWDAPGAGFGDMPASALEEVFGLVWDPPHERLVDVADGQLLTVAGTEYRVSHTPGHTPGHVTFHAEDLTDVDLGVAVQGNSDGVLFSGDLIFQGSIGRTDFPRGSTKEIFRSLVDTVLPLADGTAILSGHGPATTVGQERRHNPFLAQAQQQT